MARRAIRTDRLIAVLGGGVLLLGVAAIWVLTHGGGFGREPPSAEDRALIQLRDHLGPMAEIRYTEAGSGRTLCGYAGRRGQPAAVAFISRPNRVLLADDPLPGEFNSMMKTVCPGFARANPRAPAA